MPRTKQSWKSDRATVSTKQKWEPEAVVQHLKTKGIITTPDEVKEVAKQWGKGRKLIEAVITERRKQQGNAQATEQPA